MGLLDPRRNFAPSLFNGMDLVQGDTPPQVDPMAIRGGPMPTMANAAPEHHGKGGFLGTGYDGEDILSMLLRAASIAQGDYAGGAEFGANIGARARQRAQQAALQQALAANPNMTDGQRQLAMLYPDKAVEMAFREPAQQPESIREAAWLNDPARTKDELAAYYRAKGPILTQQNGNTVAFNRDGTPYGSGGVPHVTDQASYDAVPPGGQYTTPDGTLRTKSGGGVSNGTGMFPPRKRATP